jgi:hypothetical protein
MIYFYAIGKKLLNIDQEGFRNKVFILYVLFLCKSESSLND